MKNMLIAGLALVLSVVAFSACKNDNKNASIQTAAANAAYVCPMHPEVAGKAGDKCSKCGMDLEPGKAAAYACPMHPEVTGKMGDKCSKCGMALEPAKADATAAYACPMHPEVTGKMGDKCPKCGMALEPAKTNAGKVYKMAFSASPATMEAGKAGTLSLKPEIVGQTNTAVPLDLHHEKKIHLIAVSKDLAWFEHIHPEYNADGSYQIKVLAQGQKFTDGRGKNETMFERGGDYVLFADYMPTGASGQLERIPVTVTGTPYKPVTFSREKLISTVDGYTVTLQPNGGKFLTNNQMHIEGTVTQGGKAVAAESFENYLGAKAHVVVISADTEEYLHVHPEVAAGKLDLHATFEKPGMYRGWLQFQTGGKVHTADFVLHVTAGKPGTKEDHGHSHEGGQKAGDGHTH